jgi:hypothetical protein
LRLRPASAIHRFFHRFANFLPFSATKEGPFSRAFVSCN